MHTEIPHGSRSPRSALRSRDRLTVGHRSSSKAQLHAPASSWCGRDRKTSRRALRTVSGPRAAQMGKLDQDHNLRHQKTYPTIIYENRSIPTNHLSGRAPYTHAEYRRESPTSPIDLRHLSSEKQSGRPHDTKADTGRLTQWLRLDRSNRVRILIAAQTDTGAMWCTATAA